MLWNVWVVHSFPLLNSIPIYWVYCSVIQLCLPLCNPVDPACQSPPSSTISEFAQIHVHYSLMLSNHLMLHCSLLIFPSACPSIRAFSSELAHHIRWPKYWSFSFSNSPLSEDWGLISFRNDWLILQSLNRGLLTDTSTIEHHFHFGTATSFFLELLLMTSTLPW